VTEYFITEYKMHNTHIKLLVKPTGAPVTLGPDRISQYLRCEVVKQIICTAKHAHRPGDVSGFNVDTLRPIETKEELMLELL
jgi:hypothetical protein